ncbi:MAG: FecR domain-containing protein [Alphaproteobacteria bacterium]|nr:FecR domain-containing protein [Alphaproteobacteria bacterium]
MAVDRNMQEEAIDWSVRTSDPAFADWDAFTQWLEASPDHAEAYDSVMAAVADAAEGLRAVPEAVNDGAQERATAAARRRWFAPAIAACLVGFLALGVWQFQTPGGTYRTAPGEMRTIRLDDGSQVALAGDSRIEIVGERSARLEAGRALFTVVHDSDNPFVVEVADRTLLDAGTIFDVNLSLASVDVAVSEGLVIYDPAEQRVRVEPGEALRFSKSSDDYVLSQVPVDQVGEWTSGRLTFRGAPLEKVAVDLRRASGIDYVVARNSASHQVSGSIMVSALRESPAELGPLLGVRVSREGGSWVLTAP